MTVDTFTVIANQYDAEEDALADYEAVRLLYTYLGIVDTYDAAVLTRKENGRVHVVRQVEEPTRQAGAAGLVGGLALGALVALFPAVGLGAGLLAGGAIGAGAGAAAGHVVGGMSRAGLKELGELLDTGSSGLVVVAAPHLEARVEAAVTRADKRAKSRLRADTDALRREIEEL